MKTIRDPFEPTPEGFHLRIEHHLRQLDREGAPKRHSHRWVAVLAILLGLLAGTAFALSRTDVLYFFQTRYEKNIPMDKVAQPLFQTCNSTLLNVDLRDAYWDGELLSISVHVSAKGEEALYIETDVGQDGESFDKIWWKGEILPLEDWLAGRPALELLLPEVILNGETDVTSSWDWVQDEQGETMLIQAYAADMSTGAELTLTLQSIDSHRKVLESAVLTALLPAMEKAPRP